VAYYDEAESGEDSNLLVVDNSYFLGLLDWRNMAVVTKSLLSWREFVKKSEVV
jgi:hypothetical protein